MPGRRAAPADGKIFRDLVSTKVMKDEGLIFSVLKLLSLKDARRLWRVQHTFLKVLDGKVIPLLALYERDWAIVSHYMDAASEGSFDGYPRFEYSYETMCVEALMHHDFEGLQLLAWRRFNFARVQGDRRLLELAREALQQGRPERVFLLRSIGFDCKEVIAEVVAAGELSESFLVDVSVSLDFLGSRLSYRCSALDFACTDYVEQQIAGICSNRDNLFKVPFLLAALVHVGASACCFLRPEGCGYLLLLALASESFNFVYVLVKEAIHLRAVLKFYHAQLVLMLLRALAHHRFAIIELLRFCGFVLSAEDEVQAEFDRLILGFLLREDFAPIEHMHRLGFSLRRFAERNNEHFHAFVQSRLESAIGSCGGASAQAPPPLGARATGERHGRGPVAALGRLAALDWQTLELHFQSHTFLSFADGLLMRRSFVALRQVAEIHPHALSAFFMEHHFKLESLLLDAFLLRDISLVVDLASLSFPMGPFFARNRAQIDAVLLNVWFPNKCWTELGMLKSEVKQWNFQALFERNEAKSDDIVIAILRNGYWFDLHHLQQLGFDFPSLFDRRFDSVSAAAIDFITAPQPHFVLLRELSALSFPWKRFMDKYRNQISASHDDDFFQFVISLEGFEPGSKVYDVVDKTCRLYHAMAASVFGHESSGDHAATGSTSPADAPLEDCAGWESSSAISGVQASSSSGAAAPPAVATPRRRSLHRQQPDSAVAAPRDRPRHGGGDAARATPAKARGSAARAPSEVSSDTLEVRWTQGGSSDRPDDEALLHSLGTEPVPAQRAAGSKLPEVAEAAIALRARAASLVKRAREKRLDIKQIIVLMLYKGAYSWNPLRAASESSVWAEIESVQSFLESRDLSSHVQMLPGGAIQLTMHHMRALVGAGGPRAARAAVQAVAVGRARATAGGISLPPPVQTGNGAGVPQMLFHIVCLAQRGEERAFAPKLDLFWSGILDTVLPLSPAA